MEEGKPSRRMSTSESRGISWSKSFEHIFGSPDSARQSIGYEEDEEALKLAALEKLPTYSTLRTSIVNPYIENETKVVHIEVDVTKHEVNVKQESIDKFFKVIPEKDNEKLLKWFRQRIDKVGISLPTVEIRFDHLSVESEFYVGDRALPTLLNATHNLAESALGSLGFRFAEKTKLAILKEVSGIIKPSRMTLLLGPPSSGKTTLLLALAGKLNTSLKVEGEITYNGHRLNEFVPQKTSVYISENDVHIGEMTVKETIDFAARCQGVGSRYDLLTEIAKRERQARIFPNIELDIPMKANVVEEIESIPKSEYILKILGLVICQDTNIGDAMNRGISGGQKKRVTTGEMLVSPRNTLLMDEISNGLDSSTTFQIVKCLQQIVRFTDATVLMSLLQPTPETFDLFDDVILLSEGQIVYQGPREHILEFFQSCGFKCSERKGTADFLQEVISRKDQEQYWADKSKLYKYISVTEFVARFQSFHVGLRLENELSIPCNKAQNHDAALVYNKYSVPRKELLKACFGKEWLLIKRHSGVYVFKTVQIIIFAIVAATVFRRPNMHTENEDDGALYMGALGFTMVIHMFNGYAELALTLQRLPVFYKHRDLLFHPTWTVTLPNFLLRIPISVLESIIWMIVTYFTIGFAPEPSRFFKQFLLVFLIQQMAAGFFRFIVGMCRTNIIANTCGSLLILLVFLLGGFILPRGQIPKWWEWGYWVSPLTYSYNALAVNEMFAPRWMNRQGLDNTTALGVAVLNNFDVFNERNWFWIGAAALLGYIVLFNILFTVSLMYLNPIGKSRAVISTEAAEVEENHRTKRLGTIQSKKELVPQALSRNAVNNPGQLVNEDASLEVAQGVATKRGMVLPFTPLAMSFNNVSYFVDMPSEMKEQGVTENKLQLLREVTGAFRPGVLTALMGVSGAGKTTLMDVLAGRKTGGYIEGDIRISGFPKVQETFARISGYCEQTDIHSPLVTVRESLVYSAFLRLTKEVTKEEKMTFVDEVMELVELENLKDAIVGIPGITGLSTEQRKRLTIAVELVANPSIIFMDEPTSGLDARAASIVMRTVRNTVDMGRTVVCTIHQPSIDIFEAFDELLLMKKGGEVIYSGQLGRNSHKIIEYFQNIPGVPKIQEKQNPGSWMLEASSVGVEDRLGIDFSEHYKASTLYQISKAQLKELSLPPPMAQDLYFSTQYSQSMWGQFKSCIWKQWLTYWRNPEYNLVRYFFTIVTALITGTIFWQVGAKRDDSTDLLTVMGAMYVSVLFVGINNNKTIQPIVALERTVFYRERAAGTYSELPYALAQVIVELPYVLGQTVCFSFIAYPMIGFEWVPLKFFWFFFISYFSFLYFTYFGMMCVSITPNQQVAAILSTSFYTLFNLFSGFYIPRPKISKWWIWYYWICPVAWTVYGLIVSQYADIQDKIKVPGMTYDPTIQWYVENHFGYRKDFIGQVAIVLVAFVGFFSFMYAYFIKTLNFQKR